jgi:glycosyltransferase involved in cell wall biosynthesis
MAHKIYNFNNTHTVIDYSIVVPIHNQCDIIVNNLNSYIINTINPFEIILILDFCSDKSEENIITFLDKYDNINNDLVQIIIYKTEEPLFETKCDNIGFKSASGKYCLEIQADMEMIEHGYNLHLTKPFKKLDNVIAVSGRCSRNLFRGGGIGKLGLSVEKSIEALNINKNKFYVYETCNRGPLLIDRNKLIELDYLNENIYYLDDSDRDLMARAYLEKKYICGYVPIDFNAPLKHGSTRSNKCKNQHYNHINQSKKRLLHKIYKENNKLPYYKSIWKNKATQVYDI